MKITFHCSSCDAQLSAEESLVGREITCPRCHKTTRIAYDLPKEDAKPRSPVRAEIPLDADGGLAFVRSLLRPNEDDFEFEEQTQTSTETATETVTASESGAAADRSDFALEGVVYQSAQVAETESALRNIAPEFHANPFGVSFPLERLLSDPYGSSSEPAQDRGEEDAEEEEEFDGFDNLPDVDELIKGVE